MKIVLLAFAISFALPCSSQFSEKQQDIVISSQTRAELIDSVISKINNGYVFSDRTKYLEKVLRKYEAEPVFGDTIGSIAFVAQINRLLFQASQDKHLQLLYSHQTLPQQDSKEGALPEFITQFAIENNYGFVKLEILKGNIGYMNVLGFFPFEEARDAAISAFRFVENTAALIVDLRQNNGGESNIANFVISYFFDQIPVNFLSNQFRKERRMEESWSASYLPGRRYLNRPVYILTSNQTFSAGEAMAFVLQSFKKATIVGETTGGGGNICDLIKLNNHVMINLPVGYPIIPGTKKNWDGTGVIPDIKTSSDKALEVAVLSASKLLSDSTRLFVAPHRPSTIRVVSH